MVFARGTTERVSFRLEDSIVSRAGVNSAPELEFMPIPELELNWNCHHWNWNCHHWNMH